MLPMPRSRGRPGPASTGRWPSGRRGWRGRGGPTMPSCSPTPNREALRLSTAAGQTDEAADLQELAGRSLEMAGDRALGLDARRAADHFVEALALLPPDDPGRAGLLEKAAE